MNTAGTAPTYKEMSDQDRLNKAFAIARMLDGININDAENILRDTAQFIKRGACVATTSPLFLGLEASLLEDACEHVGDGPEDHQCVVMEQATPLIGVFTLTAETQAKIDGLAADAQALKDAVDKLVGLEAHLFNPLYERLLHILGDLSECDLFVEGYVELETTSTREA